MFSLRCCLFFGFVVSGEGAPNLDRRGQVLLVTLVDQLLFGPPPSPFFVQVSSEVTNGLIQAHLAPGGRFRVHTPPLWVETPSL